jgi:hypothetical protein
MKEAVEKYSKDPSRYSDDDLRGMLEGTAGAGMIAAFIVNASTPEKRAQLVKDIEELAKDPEVAMVLKWMAKGDLASEKRASQNNVLFDLIPELVWCIQQGT